MAIPCYCPNCGDIIGVVSNRMMSMAAEAHIGRSVFKKPNVGAFFDSIERMQGIKNVQKDPKVSCKGTHGKPVRETLKRKFFNLIKVEQTTYPNGSFSSWEEYDGPSSGLKFLLLLYYVKILRKDVFGKEWIFPFLSTSEIKQGLNKH